MPPTVVVAAGGVVVVVEVALLVLVMIFVDTTSVIEEVESEVTSTVLGGNVSLTDVVDIVVVIGMVTVGSV